ncbi:MAG TPA: hypothetical protein VEW48_10450 [Thermoanaerobaculia bacterium]|nr:hypothetical protein [Thermoanaerobaculia bacterium]
MEPRDLDRIRFVTQHFNDLQGLRYGVPLGLVTLAWAGPAPLRAPLLLGAVLLTLGARWYYRRTFGEVEQQPADPAAELCPVSLYSPAGPMPRLDGFRQVTAAARHFLLTMALVGVCFGVLQAMPPSIQIQEESLGQPPRIVPAPAFRTKFEPAFLHGASWLGGLPMVPLDEAGARAGFAQTTYVLFGAFFLGFWLWRERRWTQGHHLVLAVLLLGLSALGTSLGFFAQPGGEIPAEITAFLPALIYPEVALLLCGSAMVVAGLLDHCQLVWTMEP